MLRSATCGELRLTDINKEVTLCGWVQRSRDKGTLLWVDLRDRYGITQLFFDENFNKAITEDARKLSREFVIKVKGIVTERESKNKNIPTGDIEIKVSEIVILNE